jgi:DNA adenine methylase
MRAVLKYPGSKWNIASQLVEMIPEHHSYVEPFFGSGAVLFNKPVSDIETILRKEKWIVNVLCKIRSE